jgi:hypothetical protein
MLTHDLTFAKALKGGAIAGLIGVGLNNFWSILAGMLGATVPPGFVITVTVSSILPVLIGATLFFVFVKFVPKGHTIWFAISIGFILFSFYPVFNTSQLADGTRVDDTFPMLVVPMHIISGFLAVWGIPKWSK